MRTFEPSIFRRTGRTQGGFTLIEILIAVLVLSFGLLGLAMLQATGLKYNTDSYMRTQATLAAYSIMDRIRANPKGAQDGDYVASAAGTPTCGSSTACAQPSDIATYDIAQWYSMQQATLVPAAQKSQITRQTVSTAGGSGQTLYQYKIFVRWNERGTDFEQQWVLDICKDSINC